jgi:hypothetical protein
MSRNWLKSHRGLIYHTVSIEITSMMIKAMTDLTGQFADLLKAEIPDLMATRQQFEGSLHSWRM